jgi:hypothetical protein
MASTNSSTERRSPVSPSVGIFCLEGDWDVDLRYQATVEPILQMLDSMGIAKYLHRNTVTADQFLYYLEEWTKKRYDDYSLLYVPAHGEKNSIYLGKDSVSLDDVVDVLSAKPRKAVVHFGGCSTMDIPDDVLKKFVKDTKITAVTGYRKSVAWLEAAAFETLMLERLTRGSRTDGFFNGLARDYGTLSKRLGLVAATAHRVYSA